MAYPGPLVGDPEAVVVPRPGLYKWGGKGPRGQPLRNPIRQDIPTDMTGQAQYKASATDGPGFSMSKTNNVTGQIATCEINGGSHQCSFWITKHMAAPVVQSQCGRKTALVGVDLDFYRCADPNGKSSRKIDKAIFNQTLRQVRGRAYFCYLHLQKLLGVVPRRTPDNRGWGLRALRFIPQWSLVACYGMMPILPAGVTSEDHRYITQWSTDPANPANMPLIAAHPSIAPGKAQQPGVPYQLAGVPAPGNPQKAMGFVPIPRFPKVKGQGIAKWQAITNPVADVGNRPDQYFDGTCYRDLADYVNDGRFITEGAERAVIYPAECLVPPPVPPPVGKAARSKAAPRPPPPPAKGAGGPAYGLPIDQGLNTAQWLAVVQAIPPGGPLPVDPRLGIAAPPATIPIPAGSGPPGLNNEYCWQPRPLDSVNCAIRRVRFRYFDPYWPRPVGSNLSVADITVWTPGTQILERIAIYTLVDVLAGWRAGEGIDLTIDRGNEFWARQFCPTIGNSSQTCTTFKMQHT
jgi:hypothetical protein